MTYSVSVQHVAARPIAAVRARMRLRDVTSSFRTHLDQVYAAAREHAIPLDGENVFVYHPEALYERDIEFGVGVREQFTPIANVAYSEVPGGRVATTSHWGDYGGLGAAHAAVVTWCAEHRHRLTGLFWESYGHWHDDPARRRTDVYYMLEEQAN